MTGKLDAILLPAPGINIVHDLDPVLARNSARLVITGALPQDDLLEENLDAFLRGYNVTLHREHHATHYIPAPGCTCAIYTPPRRHTQFPSRQIATPAAALFSFGSTRLYLNGSRPASAAAREAQKRLAINNDILLYTEKNVSLLPGRRRIAPDSLATTGGEGALVIRIKNNGNVTVTRVGESAVSGLTRL